MMKYSPQLKLLISFSLGAFSATLVLQGPTLLQWSSSFLPSQGKVWNWCPQNVNQVVILTSNRAYSKTEDFKFLCAAVIEPNPEKQGQSQAFQAIMKAQNQKGEMTFVERSEDQAFFRVDGQIFSSNQLQRILRRYQ
ncbi:MAG: hypothetical protein ACXWRE_03535 [Pseudobdellovibrionaceae bacterium]